jgi:sec-independent protein translocase protein TatA
VRLGGFELLIILGVVLLFFGPKRLPGLGNALGSAIRGFKRGLSGTEDPDAPAVPGTEPAEKLPGSEDQQQPKA